MSEETSSWVKDFSIFAVGLTAGYSLLYGFALLYRNYLWVLFYTGH